MPTRGPKRFYQPSGCFVGTSGFSPTSSESAAFLARTSGLNDAHKGHYDTLITGLVNDGVWGIFDVLYIWATDTQSNALLNLVSSNYPGTEIGSVNFTSDRGYTGDGSTFAIDSGFNPNSASSPQYTLDSASYGIYVLTDTTSGGNNGYNIGSHNVGDSGMTAGYFGNAAYQINGGNNSVGVSTTKGLTIATRTASNAVALYKNGDTTAINTNTTASDFLPRRTYYFFAVNEGSVTFASLSEMSAGFIGSKLTAADMALVANRLNTYMSAYSIAAF